MNARSLSDGSGSRGMDMPWRKLLLVDIQMQPTHVVTGQFDVVESVLAALLVY